MCLCQSSAVAGQCHGLAMHAATRLKVGLVLLLC